MTFWKTVAAYLTGWLIAQPTYTAIRRRYLKREMAHPSEDTLQHYEHQAKAIVNEMERRRSIARRD